LPASIAPAPEDRFAVAFNVPPIARGILFFVAFGNNSRLTKLRTFGDVR